MAVQIYHRVHNEANFISIANCHELSLKKINDPKRRASYISAAEFTSRPPPFLSFCTQAKTGRDFMIQGTTASDIRSSLDY